MTDIAPASPASPPDLLRWLIDRQQDLSAVERYARRHDELDFAAGQSVYRDAIPISRPGPGEQYAFEVDLDGCTGCKACVTACHSMNGLETSETWRSVGLLHGGTAASPWQQTVTTACHHCVDPACLAGCPVEAYAKDPITGIVRHLDDQCIGCQYCTLMCPYDVPKYSRAKGIVRKCDMCQSRLAVGEAPACVQACPNQAIRITVVTQEAVIADNEAGRFLPGTPDPAVTQPTTIYKSARPLPRNALPADYYDVHPEQAHPPLVAMLVLTQLSVGTVAVTEAARALGGTALDGLWRLHAVAALLLGLIALNASLLHLGRPRYAFRALLGLRRSWLSREIVAFGAYAGLASLHAAAIWLWPGRVPPALGIGVGVAGLGGVFCSIMVYVATRRACWRADLTGGKFLLTTAVLGLATSLAIAAVAALFLPGPSAPAARGIVPALTTALAIVAGVKLLFEGLLLRHARDRHHGALKRSALLLIGPLRRTTVARFSAGAIGGVALPLLFLAVHGGPDAGPRFEAAVAIAAWAACLAGELLERHLFFVAVASPRMPGGLP
jgi:Fe-S-cluster-containing dehydrogenase component/DMSO reductase anchor subunit